MVNQHMISVQDLKKPLGSIAKSVHVVENNFVCFLSTKKVLLVKFEGVE